MIAFVSNRGHEPGGWQNDDLWVMQADGGGQRRLTRNASPDEDPHWTADGEIAFTACELDGDGAPLDCRLDVIRPDGRARRTLVDRLGVAFGARLSPDGSRVVLARMDGRSHYQHVDLYVREVDGGGVRRLTDDDTGDGNPVWSPDGERIAFVSNRAPSATCLWHDCGGFTNELYVMDADGSDVTRLTETPHDEGSPAWSPDSALIVFARILDEEDDYDLHVVNADGSCERQLTDTPEWEGGPAWLGGSGGPLDC